MCFYNSYFSNLLLLNLLLLIFFMLFSVAGLKVADQSWFGGNDNHSNVYSPSKFAVTALSETLVNELKGQKTRVTVSL